MNRVIWIVLDSVGMGELPDADRFGDRGANTILHASEAVEGFDLPNMRKLGYGNITGMKGVRPVDSPAGGYGRLMELSNGKDSVTGHWEMTGILTENAFRTFPGGFPKDMMDEFLKRTGLKGYLGNRVASGTQIMNELGAEHIRTGYPIIYTSSDSVFQICAHEEVIPVSRLYEICQTARDMLHGDWEVARVIARPFVGDEEHFTRTSNRRDFAILPPKDNLLVRMKDAGLNVISVGKIEDLFSHQGITSGTHTKDNMDGVDVTIRRMKEIPDGLIFTNLVEFDSAWGHRRNPKAYAEGLMAFDSRLPEIEEAMTDDDLLVITADHGCDPAFRGTDHTREYVPLLMYRRGMTPVNLETGESFADIGQTVCDIFGLSPLKIGKSRLAEITK